MTRLDELKLKVDGSGTEKMNELMLAVERYIKGLDKIFFERDISDLILTEIDLPMFTRELEEEGLFGNREGRQIILFLMDVQYITRHIWELTDSVGNIKTGDDLYKECPLMFEGQNMLSVEKVFTEMKHMIF